MLLAIRLARSLPHWEASCGPRCELLSAGSTSALKVWKATSPGQRGRITVDRSLLWKGAPFKPLTQGLTKTGGRGSDGRISVWHKGGGHKRLYRFIDFLRAGDANSSVPGDKQAGISNLVERESKIVRLEYDPNRSARIALLEHQGKDWAGLPEAQRRAYMLAPQGLGIGDTMTTQRSAPVKPGATKQLHDLPTGTALHNVELAPGRGGVLCRAAGTSATLIKNGDELTLIALPSGEQRYVKKTCLATVGSVSNAQHANRAIGKAGLSRHMGVRPTTRAMATNPCDHPMGGKAKKNRKSPWGVITQGVKTRRPGKPGSDQIYLTRHAARALARR